MGIKSVAKHEKKAVYGSLYGEKPAQQEEFFLRIFVLNKRSIAEFAIMLVFSVLIMGAYLLVRSMTQKLGMFHLAVFLLLGIVDLVFLTRFCAHYIVLPRIFRKVEEKITANWADAIRYSRYPATMIVSVFSIFVFICWIIVASDLKNHLERLTVVVMFAPLICAMAGYAASAIFTFRGTSPVFSEEQKKYASVISSSYWMVAEYFLVISLIDVFIIAVYFFNYIVL
ncbi:hypothetical protein KY363_07395 [Candidatus Woesearchaeota archaeon]|nr:hypothetical protein [Candidatus Woesearchaeota archaeon]